MLTYADVRGLRAIGERVLKKVEEFLESGAVQKLSALARDPNARAMKELQEVWGIGMRRGGEKEIEK